ncbi:MAG: hypothetical protein JOY90_24945 [Bradyrhizobium sp.]|uniref:hypothetical protein n=1 Tax=Bradyrhizobium sp. TaxID=376 RepID=UPI001D3A90A7|nr:hypothetical protein [Bradyrhizobium sp.]MBV9563661.1 hypothetical protein [Bradyrhizobium sp.]
MKRRRISPALVGIAISAALCAAVWPRAREAGAVLSAQDDPAQLSELETSAMLRNNGAVVAQNIDAALRAGDADLANSFVALAREKGVPVADEQAHRVADAVAEEGSSAHMMKRFASGLVTGNVEDGASLSGTVAGDLFVFGDIRDVVREGKHLAMGEQTDRVILGLAAAGLAVTAATYVSAGGAAPVRAGLTLVKDARRVGRLSEGLVEFAGRSARDIVDTPALEKAVASGSARPSAIAAAFRAEKAGGLVRLAKDVGRVTERAGTRGALDTLKIAEGPKDVERAARLAEKSGGKTRAIMKLLGRGALLLVTGAFDLTLWVFSALLTLFGLLCSIKATTERATQAWCDHKRRRRLQRQAAAAAAPMVAAAGLAG